MADLQDPSEATVQRHAEALASLPGADGRGAANAPRGLITAAPSRLQTIHHEGPASRSLAR